MNLDFLPLKTYVNIVEGNALRIDWESVVPKAELNYIMGNPPFVGYSLQIRKNRKKDILSIYVDETGQALQDRRENRLCCRLVFQGRADDAGYHHSYRACFYKFHHTGGTGSRRVEAYV